MPKKKDTTRIYNENHTYYCEIQNAEGRYFIGRARCAPEDQDFEVPEIGFIIAEARALIKALQHSKTVTKYELRTLKDYYNRIRYNKYYNEEHKPYSTIIKMIKEKEDKIDLWNKLIESTRQEINSLIKERDKLCQGFNELQKITSEDENE